MAIKKSTAKTAAKKAPAKKAPAKKAPAKKAAKKTSVKKAATKKAPAKAPAASMSPAPAAEIEKKATKKIVKKKAAKTTIIANVDVGFGNSLFIRGEGGGLSWEQGILLENVSPYEWAFSTSSAEGEITFKFLINDETWSEGDNLTVAPEGTSVSSPTFSR